MMCVKLFQVHLIVGGGGGGNCTILHDTQTVDRWYLEDGISDSWRYLVVRKILDGIGRYP